MSSNRDQTKRMSSKSAATAPQKKGGKRGGATRANDTGDRQEEGDSLLSGGMRDDLIGVALALVGVVLLVAVIVPSSAPATVALASLLRHALGIGAYIVPFAFVFWGATYFLKTEATRFARIVLGVTLIVVSVMSLVSLFHSGVDVSEPDTLFAEEVLVTGGGYVGSGIAWALLCPFGRIIATIVLAAVIISGLVLAGVPVSWPFLFVKNLITVRREEREEKEAWEASAHFAGSTDDAPVDYTDPRYLPDSDETLLYGNEDRVALTTPLAGGGGSADETVAIGPDDADGAYGTGDADGEMLDKTVALDPSDVKKGRKKPTKRTAKQAERERVEAAHKAAAEAGAGDADAGSGKSAGKDAGSASGGSDGSGSDGADADSDDGFKLPDARVLKVSGAKRKGGVGASELKDTARHLQQTLEEFNVPAEVVGWLAGPTVTMFKVSLPSGVRLNRLVSLADDIALSLAAPGVRIAQIPDTSLVGVEIPNKTRANVLLGDILPHAGKGPLQMAIGEDVDGNKICLDLAKMPHLLVGGTTGSGKSVALNGFIMTILMRSTPEEVKMILIDPKRVEFSLYTGIPHLLVPPVTEPKEAASSLKWAVAEMERRLKVFEGVGARNIGLYNDMVAKGKLTDDDGASPETIPNIVIVIDELSDLMMVAGKDVEDSIVRISQLARAAGIHLIVATQRPSANVVTGMIKANITNRIALTVSQGLESRVIIDQAGAEKLTGHGDMLFSRPEWGKPKRIQGCFVSEAEIASVVEQLKSQGEPEYHSEILKTELSGGSGHGSQTGGGGAGGDGGGDDPLVWEAADAVVAAGLGSTSMLQRRLKVGYARAGRIMDLLEEKGVVGPQDGSRAREVLIDSVEDLEALRAFEESDAEGVSEGTV